MANVVLIDDERGDVVDAVYYCSDYCARSDEAYAGWYGCVLPPSATACPSCGEAIPGDED